MAPVLITELAAVSIKPNTDEELTQLLLHYDDGNERTYDPMYKDEKTR